MTSQGNTKGLLIVMADGNISDHDHVKKASRDCNINHVFTSVYNGMQLMDLLFNRGAYAGGSHRNPDVIIMDIKLELVDGFEALKKIKDEPRLKDIPVFILTRNKRSNDMDKAMLLGANDYFEKPLDPKELSKIIQNICSVCFKAVQK